jgi:stress response protein YsnF
MAGSAAAPGEDAAAVPASRAGASDDTSEPAPETAPRVGEVRDRGDVIEIPIVEDEVEVVRRPVVKEVLRVRRDQVTEQQTIDTTVRKERIEVAQDDDVVARDNQDDTSRSR